jgi:hypothetical protein
MRDRARSDLVKTGLARAHAGGRLTGADSGCPVEPAHNARMPTPEPARHDYSVEDEEETPRRVAGTVRLMTDDPFEMDDEETGIRQRLSSIAAKSPWIIPAALVAIGVAFLVLRRRR